MKQINENWKLKQNRLTDVEIKLVITSWEKEGQRRKIGVREDGHLESGVLVERGAVKGFESHGMGWQGKEEDRSRISS